MVVRIVLSLPACPPHAMFALVTTGMIAASVPAPSPRSLLKSIERATVSRDYAPIPHARYHPNGRRRRPRRAAGGTGGAGCALAYRSTATRCDHPRSDAAGERLARNPLPPCHPRPARVAEPLVVASLSRRR